MILFNRNRKQNEAAKTLQHKHAVTAAFSLLTVVSIILLLNLLAAALPGHIDMTAERLYSLSNESKEIINELDAAVDIYFMVSASQLSVKEIAQIDEVLKLYAAQSAKIHYQTVDSEQNPAVAARFVRPGETLATASIVVAGPLYNTVIRPENLVSYTTRGNKPVPASLNVESLVTSALRFVMNGQETQIYTLMGHGETNAGEIQISPSQFLMQALNAEHFNIRPLSIISSAVPSDADLLMIISPQNDISVYEAEQLTRYLERGGRLFVHINPALFITQGGYPNLSAVLEAYGLLISNHVLMEKDSSRLFAGANGNPFVFSAVLAKTPLTENIISRRGQFIAYQPLAVVTAETVRHNVICEPVLSTGPQGSALIISHDGVTQPAGDGIYNFAVMAYTKADSAADGESTRIFVITQDGIERTLAIADNAALVINAIQWLAGSSNTAHIETKNLYEVPLRIHYMAAVLLAVLYVIVLPLGMGVSAVVVYRRRRYL
jgi:ABC-2 type transport system permease protein